MAGPFDFVKSINEHEYIMGDNLSKSEYVPYLTNISFSLFADTIYLANEMNRFPNLPHNMQYDFYFNMVRPRKRFSPWPKKSVESADITLIMEVYKYNARKAKEVASILTPEQLEKIRKNNNKGGIDD